MWLKRDFLRWIDKTCFAAVSWTYMLLSTCSFRASLKMVNVAKKISTMKRMGILKMIEIGYCRSERISKRTEIMKETSWGLRERKGRFQMNVPSEKSWFGCIHKESSLLEILIVKNSEKWRFRKWHFAPYAPQILKFYLVFESICVMSKLRSPIICSQLSSFRSRIIFKGPGSPLFIAPKIISLWCLHNFIFGNVEQTRMEWFLPTLLFPERVQNDTLFATSSLLFLLIFDSLILTFFTRNCT